MSQTVNIHTHQLQGDSGIEVLSVDYQITFKKSSVIPEKSTRYSLAIHPMDYTHPEEVNLDFFSQLLANADAIGEVGFDKNSMMSTTDQQVLFDRIAEISRRTQLPMVIHCVGRWNELEQALIKKTADSPVWIIHGFRKTNVGNRLLELGAYLSFGAALLVDKKLQGFVEKVPIDSIFLETDDADVQIIKLYEKLAEIKCLPLQSIIDQLYSNYLAVFHHE